MSTRRVSVASLLVAVLGSPVSSRTAFADAPAQDPSPLPPTDGTSPADPANEESPEPDVPTGSASDAYSDTDPSALTDFRSALDPHGVWLQDPTYGTVWAPRSDEIGPDFTPYVSAGHWSYDGDYVWVSDFTWGWVAFHYGRWQWIRETGWAWIPGRAYAGAWVAWRVGSEDYAYVGWSPMPPAWAWRDGIAVGQSLGTWQPYVFCPQADVFAPAIATRVIAGEPATVIAPHTRVYIPARPATGTAMVPAQAQSRLSEHAIAQPLPHGPPPRSLGVAPSRAMLMTGAERGVARALQYAHPSTAQALGAHPPVTPVARPLPMVMPRYVAQPLPRGPRRR